jgi:putative tricarboxylic transport membrane protein
MWTVFRKRLRYSGLVALLFCSLQSYAAAEVECIVPARPGGGFDLTCELIRRGLEHSQVTKGTVHSSYMPGGVGAITFNAMASHRSAEPNTLVAFSGGSLFNIAQGNFGERSELDVRWLAAIGTDYGVLIVQRDSPFKSLKDLASAVRTRSEHVIFGGSGTIGGQDWTKAALLVRAVGTDSKQMRFVGFEGGGEANKALVNGHVDVVSGDASEAISLIRAGLPIRILTVSAPKRLPGPLSGSRISSEDGYDLEWENIRGVYMGPNVSNSAYERWVEIFDAMLASTKFTHLREETGLQPLAQTGEGLNRSIRQLTETYRTTAGESGLVHKLRPDQRSSGR